MVLEYSSDDRETQNFRKWLRLSAELDLEVRRIKQMTVVAWKNFEKICLVQILKKIRILLYI